MAETNDKGNPERGNKRVPSVVEIEIDHPKNRQVQFLPLQERMRGRWEPMRCDPGSQSQAGLFSVPTIPGMRIKVDTGRKLGLVLDPLSFKENAELLQRVQSTTSEVMGRQYGPRPSSERPLDDDQLISWLYWMWRIVRSGSARLVQGELLTEAELLKALPGATITKEYYKGQMDREAVLTA